MRPELTVKYIDRCTGQLRREKVFADRFLDWSYNSHLGWAATQSIFCRPLISRLYAWTQRQPASCARIIPFVRQMGIDTTEFVRPVDSFESFSDFFERRIDLACRPIAADSFTCVAPVDSKVLVYERIDLATSLRIKRHTFTLQSFLRDEVMSREFDGGSLVVCRLSLADYHHIHFPDAGIPCPPRIINGTLYAGGPYAHSRCVPFYSENFRVLTRFDSDHFGSMLIVEVGAFTVGSVQQRFLPGVRVTRGGRKGFFRLGGSTVVLLFRRNAVRIDDDLSANSLYGLETKLRMGESIGRAAGYAH